MPTYVISGTRGGIGLEYVRQLSSDDQNVVVALVRDASADLTDLLAIISTAKAQIHLVECDISSPESIALLPSRLPQNIEVNTVIQNAAILLRGSGEETSQTLTAESLNTHFTTNVIGPALLLQALVPVLGPNAVVANITSGIGSMDMLSRRQINPEIPAYSISKAALNMLTVHQAAELKGKIVVVTVDPGHVKTKMGGPGATMEIADSARNVLGTLKTLKHEDSGRFILFDGKSLPW